MSENIAAALRNWVPYKLLTGPEGDGCRWLHLGEDPIAEPFFDETISSCLKLPANSSFYKATSSLLQLQDWGRAVDAVPPTAFIFHISRCGSTLVSQLLAQQRGNIVLSEVPFFDALLREGHRRNDMQGWLPLLQQAIALYGAKRLPGQRHLFVKTDSWHILFYKALRQLYPQVPFVLLYRRPDEVLRSQQKHRGMHAVPGVVEPSIFGFDADTDPADGLDGHLAKVLAVYLRAFAGILATDANTLAVNYNEGALPIIEKIAGKTGLPISDAERQAMEERAGYHAKQPGQVFAEPALEQAPPALLAEAFDWYHKVEALRLSQVAP
jgi:hypothetical protein